MMVATNVASKASSKHPSKPSSIAPSKASSITPSKAQSVAAMHERAGLHITKSGVANPNPIQLVGMGQAERAFSVASTLLSGITAISASQFIGAPLKLVDPKFYNAYMAWTKESFAVLMTTITQWWSPTVVRVSGDESMKGQLYQMNDGTLKCNFPHRLVLMANHQLYTDWLYLWWIAYTNKLHGHIYIILKESLKQLPIFGWSAQFYNFIFLSRKWNTDRHRFRSSLNNLKDPKDSMWLLIFPEGTNLSSTTRAKSAAWARKSGIPDVKHGLLPRNTGLQFCLQELRSTTNWLYDCTIAYEGVPKGLYGQDIYTLRSCLFDGRPPKSVNMFWRRFRISEIPLDNDETFARWLNNRWREKDYILEYFLKFDRFPAEDPTKAIAAVGDKQKAKHAKAIETEVKGGGWDEFSRIFGPFASAAGGLSTFDLAKSINFDVLLSQVVKKQPPELLDLNKTLARANQDVARNALKAAQQSTALPKPVLNYLVKEPPNIQEQMKRAIVKSARQSGRIDIAKKAEQAPAEQKAISKGSAKGVEEADMEMEHGTSKISTSNHQSAAHQDRRGASTIPLAEKESPVTRPSTIAVQKAKVSLGNTSYTTQQRGDALFDQKKELTAPKKKPIFSLKAASFESTSVKKKTSSLVNANKSLPKLTARNETMMKVTNAGYS